MTFEKMGLPAPQEKGEFLPGIDGALVFLNKYGVVIRIEEPQKSGTYRSDRIKDNARILKPLGSIQIGAVVVEMYPALAPEKKLANVKCLREKLESEGIEFYDHKISNVGRSPVKTEKFPEGEPVVIDVNAVRRNPMFIETEKIVNPEWMKQHDAFYAPLREALKVSWPDPIKMKAFWNLCSDYVQEEKLIAGWNKPQSVEALDEKCVHGTNRRTTMAAMAAGGYETRLQSIKKTPANPTIQILYSSLNP